MRITAAAALPIFTQRLILRELVAVDAALMADWACDLAYYKYLHVGVIDEATLRQMMQQAEMAQQQDPRLLYDLGVVEKSSGQLIGTVRALITDPYHREGLVGFGIAPKSWGQGYATEALAPLVQFAQLALGLNRLNAICDIDNVASHKVLEKLGFEREGVLRKHRRIETTDAGDIWRDTGLYALVT